VRGGVPGHLATITTAEEDAFLHGLRAGVSPPEVWVGGFQDQIDLIPPCTPEPSCGWTWVNGEGPIDDGYTNWLDAEPNDNTGEGSENFLGIALGGAFGWNDEGALGNIGGYIVEFSTPASIPATDCATPSGCVTIPGQRLIFPASFTPDNDDELTVDATQFLDDLSFCFGASGPRVHFADAGAPAGSEALIIPSIFCAYKEVGVLPNLSFEARPYIVVKTTANFAFPQGTVLVVNDTSTILPDNYDCTVPVIGDPQHQQVVLWQSTLHANMLEDGHPEVGDFVGAAGEYTIGCGSTRGAVRSGSYHVIGMSIFTGESYALNPDFVFDQFVALTRYKLVLLLESLEAAKADNAFKNGDYSKMKSMIQNAIKFVDDGAYGQALGKVDNFMKFTLAAKYTTVPGKNYSGEHDSRGRNIQFMLSEKIIPYSD
jgi:hypothetical protein